MDAPFSTSELTLYIARDKLTSHTRFITTINHIKIHDDTHTFFRNGCYPSLCINMMHTAYLLSKNVIVQYISYYNLALETANSAQMPPNNKASKKTTTQTIID